MPFDPAKPAGNSPNSSNNGNGAHVLGQGTNTDDDQNQMQQVLDKVDERINAPRRCRAGKSF